MKIPKLFFPEASDFDLFIKSSPSADLCQLVTGHCRLNEVLCNKLAVINSPMCACNKEDESVAHVLFRCLMYEQIRQDVWSDFEHTFEFIRKDWKKVDEFVRKSKRFEFKTFSSSTYLYEIFTF